jgi:hypothetical protein
MSYSLVYMKETTIIPNGSSKITTYHYTDNGLKFYQLLTKYFLKYPNELTKAEKHKYF